MGLELHTNMLSLAITQFESYKIETKGNIFHTIATVSTNEQKSLKRQQQSNLLSHEPRSIIDRLDSKHHRGIFKWERRRLISSTVEKTRAHP